MRNAIYILTLVVWVFIFSGCGEKSTGSTVDGENPQMPKPRSESTTSGTIKVGCDESLQPIGAQLLHSFEANFPNATLKPVFLPESDLFEALLKDSVRAIISCRKLAYEEKQRLVRLKINPDVYRLATGGVAILSHKDNPITQLSDEQLRKVLTGKVSRWNEIAPHGQDREITVVFDHPGSSVIRQIKRQYLNDADLAPKSFAGKNSLDVVEYVSKAPGAIGLVGYEWIADKDDPMVSELLDSVAVMALEAPDSSDMPGEYFRPYPNELILKRYPLARDIQIVSREPYTGLGTGFAIFATSDQGQRLLLKAGLVPETMPTRLIKLPAKE
jgi:phosphate transport system substrate-binding protein